MKTTIFHLSLLVLIFVGQGCQDKETLFTDPSTNITTQVKIKTEAIRSNPMKEGEDWGSSIEYDLQNELKERYGIDLEKNDLISFKITNIVATWSSARCRKLSNITTEFALPDNNNIQFQAGGGDWDFICSQGSFLVWWQVNIIQINADNDPHGIIGKDFAEAIKRGDKMTIKYSLKADEAIEKEGLALSFQLHSIAEFKPK